MQPTAQDDITRERLAYQKESSIENDKHCVKNHADKKATHPERTPSLAATSAQSQRALQRERDEMKEHCKVS